MAITTVTGYKCERCKWEWVPRGTDLPKVCPKCKSPYWNTARKREQVPAR